MPRGDNVITDERMQTAFLEGAGEAQAIMYGAEEEPLFRIQVRQGDTLLVDKPVNAEAAVAVVNTYLMEIGGADIAITIDPVSAEDRAAIVAAVEGEDDDDVVDAEVLE